MEGFKKKTIKTSRRLEYTYWVRPSLEKKPALLLQHGFPDDHELWAAIMPYLIPLGFPIIVPDLLGYGESSKPKDYEHYKLKDMSDDLIDILDKEGYQHVISVGHDWGSVMAQRVYLHHPERVVGLIIMNVHYLAPDKNDIKATNAMLTKVTGLPRAAYQEFFISPQGQDVIESDLESFFHALHGRDEGTENFMEDIFCHHHAFEDYIRASKKKSLKQFAKAPDFKETFVARFGRSGMHGPLNWYKAHHANYNWDDEKEIPTEHLRVDIPVLFIGCTRDPVCLTQAIYIPQQAGLLPDLTVEEVESGHWQTFEAPDLCGPIIAAWLQQKSADLTTEPKT